MTLAYPGKEVILPLLAISYWINYCYGKRLARSRKALSSGGRIFKNIIFSYFIKQEENQKEEASGSEVHDAKEDYLSQLPDDVLSSILARAEFSVVDVTRTSILSTRWKYLFASMHSLIFGCLNMFGVSYHNHYHDFCPYYQQKFLKGVNQILGIYSGRRVDLVEMECCFAGKFPSEINHAVRSISQLGVERLYLTFTCDALFSLIKPNVIRNRDELYNFSLEHLSEASSSLKLLYLCYCTIVQPISKIRFNSLVTLQLSGVLLASGQLESILSSSLNLKELFLSVCEFPPHLHLASSSVTNVCFWACGGVEEIDLHAANLRMLECGIVNLVRLHFSFVPMLGDVVVQCCAASMSYIFGAFARDLPAQVKSLKVRSLETYEPEYFPTVHGMFRNLKQLSLSLVNNFYCFDLAKLSPLLCACPLLQYLNLVTTKAALMPWGERWRKVPPISPTFHTELKEVTFGGFHGFEPEIEFVLYILRSATTLEHMFLTLGYRSYRGFDLWEDNLDVSFKEVERNKIQLRLHGQAISTKAVVIIQ